MYLEHRHRQKQTHSKSHHFIKKKADFFFTSFNKRVVCLHTLKIAERPLQVVHIEHRRPPYMLCVFVVKYHVRATRVQTDSLNRLRFEKDELLKNRQCL